MKLVILWSTGEYDEYTEHIQPFEWDSVDSLLCQISDKQKEYDAYELQRKDINAKLVGDNWRERYEELERIYPGPIIDSCGHEIDVAAFHSCGQWTEDLEILSLEEWFLR